MTSLQKVEFINEAVNRSSLATKKNVAAKIVDGKLIYTMNGISSLGKTYTMRVTFRDMLWTLDGKDAKILLNSKA